MYKANEILAFNIGALVLCAFNAPGRFPKSPAEAFKREASADWRAQNPTDLARIEELEALMAGLLFGFPDVGGADE